MAGQSIKKICGKLAKKTSPRQRQWLWFVGLWFGGLLAVSILAYAIRLAMGID